MNVERAVDTPPDAFRVWLTLIDLRTGKVIAKQIDRATVASVNPEPLKYYADSPTWHKDKTVLGYINSCQINTRIGDQADPEYLARLPAAAVVNEAILAYGEGKVPVAKKLYKEAETLADPGDLRVLNGLYLTSWQLGKRDEARDAFGKLVTSGLEVKRLPMKLLFQPGRTTFNQRRPAAAVLDLARLAGRAGGPHAGLRARRRPHQPHRQRARQREAVAPARRGGAEAARTGQPRAVVEADRGGCGLARGAGRPWGRTTSAMRWTGGWSSGWWTASETPQRRHRTRKPAGRLGRECAVVRCAVRRRSD